MDHHHHHHSSNPHEHHHPEPTPPPTHHTTHHPSPPPPTHHSSSPYQHHHTEPSPPTHHPTPPPTTHHSVAPYHHESHPSNHLADKPSVRVYCKAKTDYSLTIRDGQVILAPSNPSDLHQQWVKDEKYSTKVKDEEGFPSFALVNKATGQALKHSVGATHPVQLIPYVADHLDESILWTESTDLGDSYRAIRMVNNIRLNVDAFNGDKKHGGVHDGTKIYLWEWKKGDNQRWKIAH